MPLRNSIITDQLSMDFEKALSIAKGDFDWVEIHSLWGKTIEDIDEEEARQMELLLKKYSLGVSCLSTTLYLMCPLYTTVENLEKFSDRFLLSTGSMREHLEMLRRCIELADRFSTDVVRIFPFRREKGVQKEFPQMVEDMSSALADAVALAEKRGKCLAIENCPHSYLPRGNMTFELANCVKSGSLKLLYDIGNSYKAARWVNPEEFRGEGIEEEYLRIKGRIQHFHFKDYRKTDRGFEHAAFGEGDVGYKELAASIVRDGGDKCISLEPEVEQAGVLRSIHNFTTMRKAAERLPKQT
jgi:sugar phosphate isomerase/epimerase